ncbi:787_t:CDS:2 [Scutellospora calospora]|uniref:787_t:CDS:1 n=1 Tax=Scutellospora calospora TaxID=85575 RepID=A0ACA9JWY5_9GLOM|nr:787_t:CDS:2 [Scutellospora calospora]
MNDEKLKYVSKRKIKKIFNDIDVDKNNKISKRELYKYLKTNILEYFITKENKTICKLCKKKISSSFNEIIARYHFTKVHINELENIEKEIETNKRDGSNDILSNIENNIYFTYICYNEDISSLSEHEDEESIKKNRTNEKNIDEISVYNKTETKSEDEKNKHLIEDRFSFWDMRKHSVERSKWKFDKLINKSESKTGSGKMRFAYGYDSSS